MYEIRVTRVLGGGIPPKTVLRCDAFEGDRTAASLAEMGCFGELRHLATREVKRFEPPSGASDVLRLVCARFTDP
jgi:hypothetical protein